MRSKWRILPWLAATICISTPALAGPEIPDNELHDTAQEAAKTAKADATDLIVVPIPVLNPTIDAGVTLAGVLFYNPNKAPQPWISGVAGLITTNGSKGVGAFHSMSLDQDKYRIMAAGGYAKVNVNFYGIGPNAGDRDLSVDLSERGTAAMLQGQMRVSRDFYVGARYQFMRLNTKVRRENPLFPDADIPHPDFKSTSSSIGPSIAYDSRNNSTNPSDGELMTAIWSFNLKGLGSDKNYDKLYLAANMYRTIRPGSILAVHAGVCSVSTGAPFYDLCMYGQSSDLRGYEMGRYRDGATWAAQYEIRQHIKGRFGAVIFAGVGGVAPSLSDLGDSKSLPSAGIGLRYRPSQETNINMRLDYAVGRDSDAVYFSIAEAF